MKNMEDKLQLFDGMIFFLRPCKTRAHIRNLLEDHGGTFSKEINESVIVLTESRIHTNGYHVDFVLHSVERKKLQDKSKYKLPSYGQKYVLRGSKVKIPFGQLNKARQHYSPEEDEAIFKYILNYGSQYGELGSTGGNLVWKEMQKKKITNHPWQSMKDRYMKHIQHCPPTFCFEPLTVCMSGGENVLCLNQPKSSKTEEKAMEIETVENRKMKIATKDKIKKLYPIKNTFFSPLQKNVIKISPVNISDSSDSSKSSFHTCTVGDKPDEKCKECLNESKQGESMGITTVDDIKIGNSEVNKHILNKITPNLCDINLHSDGSNDSFYSCNELDEKYNEFSIRLSNEMETVKSTAMDNDNIWNSDIKNNKKITMSTFDHNILSPVIEASEKSASHYLTDTSVESTDLFRTVSHSSSEDLHKKSKECIIVTPSKGKCSVDFIIEKMNTDNNNKSCDNSPNNISPLEEEKIFKLIPECSPISMSQNSIFDRKLDGPIYCDCYENVDYSNAANLMSYINEIPENAAVWKSISNQIMIDDIALKYGITSEQVVQILASNLEEKG